MRRFHFPLQKLLLLKSQEERAARRALATAVGEVATLDGEARGLDALLRVCDQDEAAGGPAAALARALRAGLGARRTRVGRQLRDAELRLASVRATFVERRKEHHALANLRERRHEAWRMEWNAAEQSELDELARLRFAARREQEQAR